MAVQASPGDTLWHPAVVRGSVVALVVPVLAVLPGEDTISLTCACAAQVVLVQAFPGLAVPGYPEHHMWAPDDDPLHYSMVTSLPPLGWHLTGLAQSTLIIFILKRS